MDENEENSGGIDWFDISLLAIGVTLLSYLLSGCATIAPEHYVMQECKTLCSGDKVSLFKSDNPECRCAGEFNDE